MENLAKNQVINAYWASWIPNAIFLPVGIFLTIKSMRDSELFDVDNYLKPFKRFISKFIKQKKLEHSRYQ